LEGKVAIYNKAELVSSGKALPQIAFDIPKVQMPHLKIH
jgi:hypothetical protein